MLVTQTVLLEITLKIQLYFPAKGINAKDKR
jgi:hypothetical protein